MGEYTFSLARELRAMGVLPLIVTKRFSSQPVRENVFPILGFNPGSYYFAGGFIAKLKPDVVHIQDDILSFMPWLPLLLIRLRGFPLILTAHEVILESTGKGLRRLYASKRGAIEPLIKYSLFLYHSSIYQMIDKFVVHNEAVKLRLTTVYGTPSSLITVLPYGTERPNIHKDNYSLCERIVFLGYLTPNKGLELLLEAFERLVRVRPKIRLIIIGSPQSLITEKKWYSQLLERISRSEARANIKLMGHMPQETFNSYLLNSDAMVLPYKDVSHSSAATKAMAIGLPVVATRVGGFIYQIKDGVTGFLIKPDSSEDLFQVLLRLLNEPELRGRIGVNARRYSESVMSWSDIASKHLRLYEELCSKCNRSESFSQRYFQ